MAFITTIIVVHTTRNVTNANTDAAFELRLRWLGMDQNDPRRAIRFPDLPYDERERGRTDMYKFDVSGANGQGVNTANGLQIFMRMLGNAGDGWLPKSIFVLGSGPRTKPIVLGWYSSWSRDDWFDTDEPQPEHLISNLIL
ncbi:hypothetical protein BKG82_18955 [Mycobacteroides chelonae]|uniref:PLAT domain-containing protein n=1 Tax=Mycobacteroides chelonae TaxID=1774 RepID=A0A1S1LNQ8_MYCCH|nr:hypothetical protein [Mycobacteroides chelonae]OHU52345.1 hypothetical protein BKG82_18955 [Mycobacteroides chelonae]